jgi:hypothetical protein
MKRTRIITAIVETSTCKSKIHKRIKLELNHGIMILKNSSPQYIPV